MKHRELRPRRQQIAHLSRLFVFPQIEPDSISGMPKISKKKTSLKDSLLAHQNRAENAQRAKAALEKKQASTQRTSFQKQNKKKVPASWLSSVAPGTSASSRPDKGKGKATIPFQQNRKILLVGEGAVASRTIVVDLLLIPAITMI